MIRPQDEPRAKPVDPLALKASLAESTAKLAAANEHLRARIHGRTSTSAMPAVALPDAADQLVEQVKEHLQGMQPSVRARAEAKLRALVAV